MCPSFMVTREEKHSTRGRARLLFEMLNGDVDRAAGSRRRGQGRARSLPGLQGLQAAIARSTSTWPTYKAEFLLPPLQRQAAGRGTAYAMGLIDHWARAWRSRSRPGQPDPDTRTDRSSSSRRNVARRRHVPPFAPHTFSDWFRPPAGRTNPDGRTVLLFPDTFNNYFQADVGVAASRCSRRPGWRVVIPERHALLRPPALRLGHARHWPSVAAARILDGLRRHIGAGRAGGRAGAGLRRGLPG